MAIGKLGRRAFWIYLAAVHGLVAFALIKSNFVYLVLLNLGLAEPPEFGAFHQELAALHRRLDANVAAGSVLFVGSSTIQGLNVAAVAEKAVNFGIGGDTAAGRSGPAAGYTKGR